MISLQKEGTYRLIETKTNTKVLYLDKNSYAWISVFGIGEILVSSRKDHLTDELLSTGRYRLYKVEDEPQLTDITHLELEAGRDEWQSYLLLTGLPSKSHIRTRIISSNDHITGRKKYESRLVNGANRSHGAGQAVTSRADKEAQSKS